MRARIKTFITVAGLIIPFYLAAQIDRSTAPKAAPAPVIQIGDYESFVLKNGLKVFVIENHKIPRVAYSLVFDFDPILEGEYTGYMSITGELIGTGTKTRSKAEIDESVDFIGADFSASATSVYAAALTKHNEKLLEIMSDVIKNSVFSQEELDKIKKQSLSALAFGKEDPRTISGRVRSVLLYGKDHPYGELETEKSIENVTLEMCSNYYQTYFRPNIAYLAIVGDITVGQAKPLVKKYFGDWKKAPITSRQYEIPEMPDKTTVAIVDRPNAVQSVISVAYPVELKVGSEESLKASVMNTVLGGGIFRLFINLRETHGYTYGAYSRIRADKYIGNFTASSDVRNTVTDSAIHEILYEMERIVNEPVPLEELTRVKNNMTGEFALSLEDPKTISNFALNIERYDLPDDYYANYLKNLEKVNAQDVQNAAQKYIKPQNAYIIVVGKAEEIAEKLKKFNPDGVIHYFDVNGNEYDPNAKVKDAPKELNAKTVLEGYIKAIGGKEKVETIQDVTLEAKLNMQGGSLTSKEYKKSPDKYAVEVLMNDNIVQRVVLNGDVAKSSGMQGEKNLEGKELEEIKAQKEFCEELNYIKEGYQLELLGIEEVEDEEAYQVKITTPAGKVIKSLYSTETGYKLKQTTTVETPMGIMDQISEFSDYKEFQGFVSATRIYQTVGQQSFEMEISSLKFNEGIDDEVFKIE